MKQMSMRHGILFFYAFDAVLLVVLLVTLLPWTKKNVPRSFETALLNPTHASEVRSIVIEEPSAEDGEWQVLTMSRAGSVWTGTSSQSRNQYVWPLDRQTLARFLLCAQQLVTVYTKAESARDWQALGVDEAQAVSVTFYNDMNGIVSQLFFGKEDVLTGRIAFRTWSQAAVYEMDSAISAYLTADESYWADPFVYPQFLTGYDRNSSELLLRRGQIVHIAPREGLTAAYTAQRDFENGAEIFLSFFQKDDVYIVIPRLKAGIAMAEAERAALEQVNYRYSVSPWTFERFVETLAHPDADD